MQRTLCTISRFASGAGLARCHVQRRSVTGGRNATGLPLGDNDGWEVPKAHKLFNSTTLGSAFSTACGREFDPAVYVEVIQAMSDQSWGQAIGKQLQEDREYVELIRKEGGAGQKIDAIYRQGFSSDEEFMHKLKAMLQQDAHAALATCAIQDAYLAIRKKRDVHATQVAADGGADPASMHRSRRQFGENQPGVSNL
jgi:hypothetical protein